MNRLKNLLTKDNCYSIGIRKRNKTAGLLYEGNCTSVFHVLPITERIWYADPIVFSYNGIDYLFCEVFDRRTELGFIGVTVLDSLNPKPFKKILDIGTHLSYPCVFEIDGTVYMIPETTTKKTVELYRSIEFPYKWEFATELLKGDEYADSTYYSDESRKLLLTFRQYKGNGSITKLKVINAKEIALGKLCDYPSEEFVFNDQSRGGGKLFIHENKLIRPAQDCSKEYGYALNYYEVSFEREKYCERFLARISPDQINTDLDKAIVGIHTYALTDDYEIIDVKFDDPQLRYQIRRVFRYIKRKLLKKS